MTALFCRKIIILLTFIACTSVMAESVVEPNGDSSGTIKVEDSSRLSNNEIRKIAHKSDKDNLQSTSEKFVPSTDQYDWIELT